MPSATRVEHHPLYEIRRSKIDGSGAFAVKPIRKGTRIDEYVGERISNAEADRRYRDNEMETHHTWLFQLDGNVTIDAAVGGSDSRFINHSCDPNCEAIEEKGRIFIYARRAIAKGTELAYDYAYARDEDDEDEEEWERFYACRCGSANCRGTILAPKKPKKAAVARARKAAKKTKAAGTKTKAAGTQTNAAGTQTNAARKKTKPAGKKTKAAGKTAATAKSSRTRATSPASASRGSARNDAPSKKRAKTRPKTKRAR